MNMTPFPFGKLEPGVKFLLITLPVFYVLQQILPGWFEQNLGLVPAQVIGSLHLWQMFTYAFLHGSFMHLLFNLFTLWMFGKELEAAWGTKEFLKFFFLCSLGAGFLNVLCDPFSTLPVIGSSGGIYGLLVAFAVVFPESLIYLYGIIPLKSKHFVLLIGAIEFLASIHGSHSVIARFAHLGGMLTGFLYLKSYEFRSILNRLYHKGYDLLFVSKKPVKRTRRVPPADLNSEVDRILDKVLVQGADSLTESEKEIMRRYSTRKR